MRLEAQQVITREVKAPERTARLRTCLDVAMELMMDKSLLAEEIRTLVDTTLLTWKKEMLGEM